MAEANEIARKNIRKGHVFTVELPENPSTGYSWIADTTKGLKIISDKYHASGNKRIGAAGTRVWKIKATKRGLQIFNAYYQQPWADDYAEKYELVVKVC